MGEEKFSMNNNNGFIYPPFRRVYKFFFYNINRFIHLPSKEKVCKFLIKNNNRLIYSLLDR